MIETDAHGFPVEVDDLDADWLLALAEDAETAARIAERRKLRLAAQWCVLHPATVDTGAATWADSGAAALGCDEAIGGDGAPLVAAFTAEPFAAALGLSTTAGMQLLADALNLVHRLPRIQARVESLEIAPWRAQRIARATASLSREAAAHVDRALAAKAGSCGPTTIDRAVAEAAAACDPAAQAAREEKARRTWGVRLSHGRAPGGYDGTSWLDATGDTSDLTRFHALVCEVAGRLKAEGDEGDLDLRKARALGVIADRFAGDPSRSATPAQPGRAAKTTLYLHASLADLFDLSDLDPDPDVDADVDPEVGAGVAVGSVEKLGPATLTKIQEWVGHSRVTIRPVLDLAATAAVDRHDPPEAMRELVVLRDRHCVFPWCAKDARDCDLDHIEPYDDHGPPGQTTPDNLAPLCRRHHRCKTAGRWRYRRNPDGSYLWHSPQGRTYLVTPTGTISL